MPRKLVWVERKDLQAFGCSECGWIFKPSGPLVGSSIGEMARNFADERDNAFELHTCCEHGGNLSS
jgi:hypothetical protein